MKLYRTPDGVFHGRRGDRKDAEIVEVETNAEGIAKALNDVIAETVAQQLDGSTDEFTAIVERQDPPVERDERVAQTVDLDEMFGNAPLGQQLTLAAIALENARSRIGRENAPKPAPQGYGGKVERAAPTEDDDIFA